MADSAVTPNELRALRTALGAFATGVTIVAVRSGDQGIAMTVNSFTSVSLDPPLVLWCAGKESERYRSFIDAKVFGVSILAADGADLAMRFADNPVFSMTDPLFEHRQNGAPLLTNSVARFDCVTHRQFDGGDHTIIVGRIVQFDSPDNGPALTFHRGQYGSI